ncbi:MAG: PQQ-like beta-propeller repeat protein [Gemmataceae bacterium]|nr:PQQ-like beta-propeller repeat protein [Gemmataceae bacterium]MDW8266672.1 PQQ-binding-like beta-propeller repeat protein [Gemmataceae bacterium]
MTSSAMRRLSLVLLGVGLAGGLTLAPQLWAQKVIQLPAVDDKEPPAPVEFTDAITLPKSTDAPKRIAAAEDLIKEGSWSEAVRALQSLLDTKEDAFLQVKRTDKSGKESVHWVSVRAEANRLIGLMPAEGLQFYELQYGPPAKARLAEAKAKGDPEILAEVAQRYLHTEAGTEATALLGTYHLDRGRYLMAAICFERLLERRGLDQLSARTLWKAAVAFQRTGDSQKAEQVWRQLRTKVVRDGLALGDQTLSLERLRAEFEKAATTEVASIFDWPEYRGGPSRTVQGHGGPPFLEPRWSKSTTAIDPLVLADKDDADRSEAELRRRWIEEAILAQAMAHLESRQQPALPAFFPLAVGNKLIYRSHDGIYARHLKAGVVIEDGQPRHVAPGDLDWMSPLDGGLHGMGADANRRNFLQSSAWLGHYFSYGPQSIFFENSTIGCLSTDGSRVYVVDDLAIPPHPQTMANFNNIAANVGGPNLGTFQAQFKQSKLLAFDVATGKLVWQLPPSGKGKATDEFEETFFLAPPLPLGGKLYLPIEKNGELRLVCLAPPSDDRSPPTVVWTQALAAARERLPGDVIRRVHAVNLAYGDGILVCPTNAGAVIGVDLLTHSLVWARSYREASQDADAVRNNRRRIPFGPDMGQPTQIHSEWKVSAPAIAEGKTVFTAPDGSTIQCLRLRDGEPLWKERRHNDDLYMAGIFAGKVLIVGKNYCRALSLADGRQVWRIDNTGIPSGQGVASGNVYYLPLRTTTDTPEKGPGVYGIDVERGVIKSKTLARRKEEVPGNLIFYDGEVLSQTATSISAYPQLQIMLAEIEQQLKANPNDPAGLLARGELRLDKGDRLGAVDDLRRALSNNPPPDLLPKARAKLFEAFTELVQSDFSANERFLDEYRALCKVDIPAGTDPITRRKLEEEQARRQANFLCLLAKGREQQGRVADAFEAYLEFGTLGNHQELISVVDEPTTRSRPDVWARGRLQALLERATPEQRQPLEEKIAQRWQSIRDGSDPTQIRQFVTLFGSTSRVGRQARLELAERLMDQAREDDLRDAELHLLQLREQRSDPTVAGQAVETLARLMLRKGLMQEAAFYYRELGRDFATVPIRDGKTGADFFSELTTDKRFLPYLEDSRQSWNGRLKATAIPGQFPAQQSSFALEPEGEILPFFQQHRLVLDMSNFQLRVIDRTSGREVWRSDRLWTNQNGFHPGQYLYSNYNVRHVCQVKGNIVLINLAYMVYAFDVVQRKELWRYNLFGPHSALIPQQARVAVDRDGVLKIVYQDGWIQRIGRPGPLEASHVSLLTRNGLVTLDPVRGTVLWKKSDVSPRTHVFGDDQYLFLVEMSAEDRAIGSRVVRASDGVSVPAAPFFELYQSRLSVLGRRLLTHENAGNGKTRLRLYDIVAGQDLWRRELPPGTIILRSEDPDLVGFVEPATDADGTRKVLVFDLRGLKEVLSADLRKEHVEKIHEGHLLTDPDQVYVALNRAPDQNAGVRGGGGPWANVNFGLRTIPVNGAVYAFDRGSGQLNWIRDDLTNQMLIVDQFKELPIALFSVRYQELINNGPNRFGAQQVVLVKSVDKRSGKLLLNERWTNTGYQPFHALNVDVRSGIIDLISFNLKIRHTLENVGDTAARKEQ